MGRFLHAGALLMFLVLLFPAAQADILTGLIAHWTFDGNGADVSGNNYNLTLVGNPTFGPGRFGQALQLNGTNTQYAVRPIDDPAFDFSSSNFTIQIWAEFDSRATEQTLIEKFTGGAGPGWTFTTPGCGLQFYAEPTGFGMGCFAFSLNHWDQYVVERNGNTMDIYVDGTLLAVGSLVGPMSASGNPLLIGRRDAADGRNFNVNGALDDAAIWDRALTPTEIQYLYNHPVPTPEPTTMMLVVSGIGAGLLRRCRL